MSTLSRGRGYTGRHHLRDLRPGDDPEELDAVRTLAELSPRSTVLSDADTKTDKPEMKSKEEAENKEKDNYSMSGDDEAVIKELLAIDEQYAPLLALLEQFSPGEDGIQFNRKLRHFESTVTNMCPDENRLQQVFASFRAAALLNPSTARKLAAVGASFTRQQRQQLLRGALLNVCMQGTFSKLEVLERSNPLYLINATNLMGDYFAEARLCNGNKVHILASPLVQYMRALLASDDVRAHRSLATQLMQNGRELLSVLSQELDDLSISIRMRLLTPPPVTIIWLLLSADLCLNKFLPLPNTLQQFYASHLDLTPEENYSEVSYGSWKQNPDKEDSEKVAQNLSQISLTEDLDAKPKLRPILGAGAGLLRQEQAVSVSQDNFETWNKPLAKRYDLNSWRQEEKSEEEPVFNPTVLPPNFPVTVPDFPPPAVTVNRFSYPESYYLQQGDGTYIQNYQTNTNFTPQGDFNPERVNNEMQKSRRPVENWRKEKENKEDPKNKWSRQKSKDSVNEEEKDEKLKRSSRDTRPGRSTRRSSETENGRSKTPPRRHVSDVPRNHKYWDHDDRCDKDYNS